jgi:hypothetical protein
MTKDAIEQKARRLAAKHGFMVQKYRADSPWYVQYGPYAILDVSTNSIVLTQVEREQLGTALAGLIEKQ